MLSQVASHSSSRAVSSCGVVEGSHGLRLRPAWDQIQPKNMRIFVRGLDPFFDQLSFKHRNLMQNAVLS